MKDLQYYLDNHNDFRIFYDKKYKINYLMLGYFGGGPVSIIVQEF